MTVKLMQVIYSDELRHGSGRDASSPIRRVVQYWSPEGELLAEVDPMARTVTIEESMRDEAERAALLARVERAEKALEERPA